MSSNFTVNRICEHCGNVFEAKTTVTRFCSKLCNKRFCKARERGRIMASMDHVVQKMLEGNSAEQVNVDFLDVKSAAKLLRASDKMIYSLINLGKLNAVNLSKRKTLVARKDIDKLFELPQVVQLKELKPPPVSECYSMGEAQRIFRISDKALYEIIKRNNLFKFQEGSYTYVAKADLDRIFNPKA
ncbi:helix-turn-helix domain-containing protein [Mucilaginibacter sp. HD30]